MALRAGGVCLIAPDDISFCVPEKLGVDKAETNSRAKEHFLEHNSFPGLENSLVWDVRLSEDFGFIKLPANNIFMELYCVCFFELHRCVRNSKIKKATCSRLHSQELPNSI